MTGRLLLGTEARADLHEIWSYARQTWRDERAERYLVDMRRVMEGLVAGTTPSHPADHIMAGYRKARSGRHAIWFRQAGERVEVIRVVHDRMDAASRLRRPRITP